MKISLEDVLYAMDFLDDDGGAYYHKESEEIISISKKEYIGAKTKVAIDNYPEWQQEAVKWAYDIVEKEEDYISLPKKHEFDDMAILKEYIKTIKGTAKEAIEEKIASGRSFKDIKGDHEEELSSTKWYDYKDDFYEIFARNWCEKNNIQCIQ